MKIPRIWVLYMVLAEILTATGQLLWKMERINFILVGFVLYGVGALCMLKSFNL